MFYKILVMLYTYLTKRAGDQRHSTHSGKKIISTLLSPMIMITCIHIFQSITTE